MQDSINTASENASTEAQEALEGHKRRCEPNMREMGSRKKARPEKCLESDSTGVVCSRESHVVLQSIDREPYECNDADATGHQFSNTSFLSTDVGDQSPTCPVDSQPSVRNSVMAVTGVLGPSDNIGDGLAINYIGKQHSAAPDTVTATDETRDEHLVHPHNEQLTVMDSATAADTPNTYLDKQFSTVMRGTSFASHTMDGSFIYTPDQYPAHDISTALRSSSFVRNTMDGSYMYANDQYLTAQGAAVQDLEPWRGI